MSKRLGYIFGIVCLVVPRLVFASKCIEAKNLNDLSKNYEIVIVGRVEERVGLNKEKSEYALKIAVTKVLHGRVNFDTVEAVELHRTTLFDARREYQIGKEYVFPLFKYKNKYRATLQPEGCPELSIKFN